MNGGSRVAGIVLLSLMGFFPPLFKLFNYVHMHDEYFISYIGLSGDIFGRDRVSVRLRLILTRPTG